MSGEHGRGIKTSQPNCYSFFLVNKKNMRSYVLLMKDYVFRVDWFNRISLTHFSVSVAFSWPNWELHLLELIVWFSRSSSQSRTPFQSHHIYNITFFGWRSTLVWLVVHFACPMITSFPYYCTVSTFDHPSQFVLKNRMLLLCLLENHMQKYGQGGFFRLNLRGT